MQRCHEEQSARSKGARLSLLEPAPTKKRPNSSPNLRIPKPGCLRFFFMRSRSLALFWALLRPFCVLVFVLVCAHLPSLALHLLHTTAFRRTTFGNFRQCWNHAGLVWHENGQNPEIGKTWKPNGKEPPAGQGQQNMRRKMEFLVEFSFFFHFFAPILLRLSSWGLFSIWFCIFPHFGILGVSEMASAEMAPAIDVRIDDVGSILKFRIGFSFGENSAWFCKARKRRPGSILNFRIASVSSMGGLIAATLFADTVSDSQMSNRWGWNRSGAGALPEAFFLESCSSRTWSNMQQLKCTKWVHARLFIVSLSLSLFYFCFSSLLSLGLNI